MKRIYLLRHSYAGQTNKHMLNDHERPLTQKGEELCPKISQYFTDNYKDNAPEVIISSTALRARQTGALFKKNFRGGSNIEIETHQELYIISIDEAIHVISNIDEKYNSALIVSHNPGLHEFCLHFAKEGDKKKYREMKNNFPPGSFVTFDIDIKDWHEVKPKSGILLDYANSKKL